MMKMFLKFMIMISLSYSVASSITITNGPQNSTVCMNDMAPCPCGFTGANPSNVKPNWRIVYRNDSGSVINTIDGDDILLQRINGLKWIADLNSGTNNAPNSQLLVGPVNMTHNQSSYQCIFTIIREGGLVAEMSSSVGTMTVVDLPFVNISEDEMCTTSISISLNTHNDSVCGKASHIVTISGNVVNSTKFNDHKYFIDGLQSDTMHNITVTSTYNNNGSRILNRSVWTSSPKSPNPIDNTSIIIEKMSKTSVKIMWKQPNFNKCSMLAIKHYEVVIYSGEEKIRAEIIPNPLEQNDYVATFLQNLLDDYLSSTITINVTVVDMIGQRSTSSSFTMAIDGTQLQMTSSSPTEENSMEPSAIANDDNDSNPILIVIPIVAVVLIVSIIIIIITILYLRHRRNYGKSLKIAAVENCYETQDECKSQDLASPYAVSGPTSPSSSSTHSTQSNSTEVTSVSESSAHTDHADESVHNENIDENESTPPLPPKRMYAELQLANDVPKSMKADNHVTYVETKPTP